MGLIKEKQPDIKPLINENRRINRDYDGLVQQLNAEDPQERRWAVRDLAAYPDAIDVLLKALPKEQELPIIEAIFNSLQHIGGEEVVLGLIPILHSEEAVLRNGAIEVLQSMPENVALHIIELLNDKDSDIRIFAIDILQVLAHPRTPEWLLSVLKDETHINVIAAAVDRLAEVGTPDMVPDLEIIKQRFPDESYLIFAVDTAIRRIKEE